MRDIIRSHLRLNGTTDFRRSALHKVKSAVLQRCGITTAEKAESEVATGGGLARDTGMSEQTRDPIERLPELQPGQILADRYTVLQLLGRGATSVVYKASDKLANEIVALKVIRQFTADSDRALDGFRRGTRGFPQTDPPQRDSHLRHRHGRPALLHRDGIHRWTDAR